VAPAEPVGLVVGQLGTLEEVELSAHSIEGK
jgi:hypothetical protein